jgi:hypothetical protein
VVNSCPIPIGIDVTCNTGYSVSDLALLHPSGYNTLMGCGRAKTASKLPRPRCIRTQVLPRVGVDRHCKVRSTPSYLRKLSFSSTRCGYIYLFTIANMVTADERNCHGLVVPLRTINCCCGLFTGYLFIMLYNDHDIPRGVCVSTLHKHVHLTR